MPLRTQQIRYRQSGRVGKNRLQREFRQAHFETSHIQYNDENA